MNLYAQSENDYPSDLVEYQEFEDEIDYETIDLEENYYNCVQPTLIDTFQNFLFTILMVNINLKVILIINDAINVKQRDKIESLIKLLGGLFLIYDFFRDAIYIGNFLLIVIFIGTSLTYFINKYKFSSNNVWLFCLFMILSNELLIFHFDKRLRRLRAIIMLIIMKLISLINHLEQLERKEKKINFLNCLTYILHPQSLPLGGWNPVCLTNPKELNIIKNFFKYFLPFVLSLLFLLFSNCIISYIMSLIEESILPFIYFNLSTSFYYAFKGLLNAYFVALQFRCSHYFISYTMQYIHYLWGHDIQVTKPFSIEFPRSLVEVVIVWNIPMHEWLKNHLYKNLSNKFDDTKSRFLTFILSSLMHGYDFRIWSVLTTLSFLTWIEIRLRRKLSIRLNGCVEAKSCIFNSGEKAENKSWLGELFKSITSKNYESNYKCKHHNRTPFNSLIINFINLFFSILCIIHLAFLGSAFDGNEENATIKHVHEMWSYLYYYSLILFVPTFLVYKLI